MATDSTELTFVRCPSCRSLVPAVSTRCRMCGATLDAAAVDESDKEKKSGRVRQRTMSAPDSELSSTATQVRAEPAAPPVSPSSPPPVSVAATADTAEEHDGFDDDPLGDYVSEVDDGAPVPPAAAAPQPVPPPAAVARPETPPPAAAEIELTDPAESSDVPAPSEAPERPRVIVESGGRRQFGGGKPGGLSFGRPREEAKPASRPMPPPAPPAPPKAPAAPERVAPERVNHERRVEERTIPPVAREPQPQRVEPRREEPRREEPRREEPRREERRFEGREERGAPVERSAPVSRPTPSPAPVREGVKRGESVAGRLHGWLVSYADPDGRSIELREGKFFVTGSSLKESDLIITDKSISTPHALVSVGGETGLRIQDLMSDRGVFIRHGESGAYQRREEPCTVEHGDWVRFGDVEFLVCLIAHVGAR